MLQEPTLWNHPHKKACCHKSKLQKNYELGRKENKLFKTENKEERKEKRDRLQRPCTEPSKALIHSSHHLWFTALKKKRQTKQLDRRTDKQIDWLFHWRWHFCRTGAAVMIDLSCNVHLWFKDQSQAQRHAHKLEESVKLSPPAVTFVFDLFKSGRVNSVSSLCVCNVCGCRYLIEAYTC